MDTGERADTGRQMLRKYVALPGLTGAALVQAYMADGNGDPSCLDATVTEMATDVGLALSEDGYSFEAAVGGALRVAGARVERNEDGDEFEHAVGLLSRLGRVLVADGQDPHLTFAAAVSQVEAEFSPAPRL